MLEVLSPVDVAPNQNLDTVISGQDFYFMDGHEERFQALTSDSGIANHGDHYRSIPLINVVHAMETQDNMAFADVINLIQDSAVAQEVPENFQESVEIYYKKVIQLKEAYVQDVDIDFAEEQVSISSVLVHMQTALILLGKKLPHFRPYLTAEYLNAKAHVINDERLNLAVSILIRNDESKTKVTSQDVSLAILGKPRLTQGSITESEWSALYAETTKSVSMLVPEAKLKLAGIISPEENKVLVMIDRDISIIDTLQSLHRRSNSVDLNSLKRIIDIINRIDSYSSQISRENTLKK